MAVMLATDLRWKVSHDAAEPERVIAVDGWRTIFRGPYPEPIKELQEVLGHAWDGDGVDPSFLDYCLTLPVAQPGAFLADVARRFGCLVTAAIRRRFLSLVEHERNNLLLYWDAVRTLKALKRAGYGLALVSNTWVFPMARLQERTPLGRIFDHWIGSYDVERAKPHPAMFAEVCRRFAVRPDQVVMIGDNPRLDVLGALRFGMHAVHLQRDDPLADSPASAAVRVIHSLSELRRRRGQRR